MDVRRNSFSPKRFCKQTKFSLLVPRKFSITTRETFTQSEGRPNFTICIGGWRNVIAEMRLFAGHHHYYQHHRHHHHHQSVLPKGRSFSANAGTKVAVLPKTGLPSQIQEPRLQFYQEWIGAVASRFFFHPTLILAFEQTLKDLKRSQRGGEENEFGLLCPPDFTEIHHRG